MTPDFSQMYAELGLQPDCSLEQFRHACRQRISELHPDRAPNPDTPAGGLSVGELIALQSAALAFHREHGRLPGSPLRHVRAGVATARPTVGDPGMVAGAGRGRRATSRWPLAVLLLASSLVVGMWLDIAPPQPPVAPTGQPQQSAEREFATALPNGPLELGMDAATVRLIQGDPMRIHNNTWEYGPSWLRIEHNRLVDWYSSPLYRLNTRTSSPDADDDATD